MLICPAVSETIAKIGALARMGTDAARKQKDPCNGGKEEDFVAAHGGEFLNTVY